MGVPTSEVGYTSAIPRREDHEVRKGHVGHWIKKKTIDISLILNFSHLLHVSNCLPEDETERFETCRRKKMENCILI